MNPRNNYPLSVNNETAVHRNEVLPAVNKKQIRNEVLPAVNKKQARMVMEQCKFNAQLGKG